MASGFLARWFGRKRLPSELRYEDARRVLESHQQKAKRELAAREDAPPEALYYLACDDDPEVRGLVAANRSAPIQANELLQDDTSAEVRGELARKIARLMPDIPAVERSAIQDRLIGLLEKLAEDELPRVRAIVAEEIASCPTVPRAIARRLARDAEMAVCGPILEYSPLLSDEDLIEIIATSGAPGAAAAIARRACVSTSVSDAVVTSRDEDAIGELLSNKGARIREDTMERIIERAPGIKTWHKPLVVRPELSMRAVRRIATFVSRALIDELRRTHDLDRETADWLKARAQSRIENGEEEAEPAPRENIRDAYAAGRLGDEIVMEAATTSQRASVVLALSLLSGVPATKIEEVIAAQSGRGIAALCWKAGLSMRTALAIQTYIAHVPQPNLVLPREGIAYPMTQDEMRWHLQYFGADI
ncbi:MAG: hypothetical protein CMI62_13240 [Parvibaculum sp.]|jgi:uncharacterized protein (DUF2336 family)|uniref:DUF2336 domain-containing protein n=1 Tax=Parvibaculum sp. TaxID=2024848 RepID=UPI000C4679BD|nr:DUF2336 domain-containing protein [Parvibaculum sp.]MAU61681.1 hypothetical protein [Parvibaculum sp.]|tara:strand:- start:10968 stop:12227 length:1260 start_codon:yes stop_codon:yes gene_type:complete